MGHGFLNPMCSYENITCNLFKPCEYPRKMVCCGCSAIVENVFYEFFDKSWVLSLMCHLSHYLLSCAIRNLGQHRPCLNYI